METQSVPWIMYVDDDPDDQDLFCEVVRSIDTTIPCTMANDGLNALQLLKNAHTLPALIFIDVNMPVMGGQEFLTQLKTSARYRHIPVVMYSTTLHTRLIDTCRKFGVNHFIRKGNSIAEIRTALTPFVVGLLKGSHLRRG